MVDKSVENKKEKKISKIKEQLARLREKLKTDNQGGLKPTAKPKPAAKPKPSANQNQILNRMTNQLIKLVDQ